MTSRQKLNESEAACKEWLKQIGAIDILFVGDQQGPPDFEAKYGNELIAIEVTRIQEAVGWPSAVERAFERQLKNIVEQVTRSTRSPAWHSRCTYDPRESRPPKEHDSDWKDQVCKALLRSSTGGTLQLLPEKKIKGRGVRFKFCPASDEGSFSGVQVDEAIFPAAELCSSISRIIPEKTRKVRKGERLSLYKNWWLVLGDEICIVPTSILGDYAIQDIKRETRTSTGIEQWQKIILLTRYQIHMNRVADPISSESPKHFLALWEDPLHPPLPPSP